MIFKSLLTVAITIGILFVFFCLEEFVVPHFRKDMGMKRAQAPRDLAKIRRADRQFLAVIWILMTILIGAIGVLVLITTTAHSRDLGQWENNDPAVGAWYRGLMQPDNVTIPCCGEADAWWADKISVRGDKTFATITDDRDDTLLRRPHRDVGEEFEIPPNKLKWDNGNPTGHNILFLTLSGGVLCFVQAGGV